MAVLVLGEHSGGMLSEATAKAVLAAGKLGGDVHVLIAGQGADAVAAAAAKLDPRPTNFTDPRNAARLTPEWIYQVIRDGGPTHGKSPLMVSWGGTLTDADVRDLASHVLRLKTATKSKAR